MKWTLALATICSAYLYDITVGWYCVRGDNWKECTIVNKI